MSDRTQTLSVELTFDEIYALLEPDTRAETPAFVSGFGKLRAALSQPEHQGDKQLRSGGRFRSLRESVPPPSEHQGDELDAMAEREKLLEAEFDSVSRGRDEWRARYRREKKARKKAQGRARHWKHNHGQQVYRVRQLAEQLKATQPPAPVLSDEERERLGKLGEMLEALGCEPGYWPAFLRNLASREHRGEEGEQVDRLKKAIELALPQLGGGPNMSAYGHFAEDCALVHLDHWAGLAGASSALIDALSGVTGESGPDLYARLVPSRPCDCKSCVGEEAHAKAVADYIASVPQPPAGEVERLRERLSSEDVRLEAARALCPDEAHWEDFRERYEADASAAIDAALRAAVLPPSDSQGDQERRLAVALGRFLPLIETFAKEGDAKADANWLRCFFQGLSEAKCSSCDGSRVESFGPSGPVPCPDCNPAPTQVEGDDALPPELERALRDPSVIVDADRKSVLADGKTLAEHLEEWRNAPSNTVSADPSLAASSQPEGGDEEDWGPVTIMREKDLPGLPRPSHFWVWWGIGDYDNDNDRYEARRYLPATSQDSSGLEERLKDPDEYVRWPAVIQRERDRASKAEAERDREKALREDAYRYQQAAEDLLNPEQKRAARAETALGELAEGFERRAAEFRNKADAGGSTGEVALWEAIQPTFETAAQEARKKAAELKEGP